MKFTPDEVDSFLRILLARENVEKDVSVSVSEHFSERHPAEILHHALESIVEHHPELIELHNVLINFAMRAKLRIFGAGKRVRDLIPNCFVIGQPRSCTTSLHEFFVESSDVFVPFVKEINYYSHLDRSVAGECGISISDYAAFFHGAAGEKYRCDISPFYLSEPGVALRIYRDVPNAKIIVILRDPVSRLVSTFNKFFDADPGADLVEWIDKGRDGFLKGSPRWDHDSGVTAFFGCFISNQLAEYVRYFSGSMKILLYDDFVEGTDDALMGICDFLGIEQHVERRYDTYKSRRQEILPEAVAQDLRHFFRYEIDRLEVLVGRDLTKWRVG